MSRWVLKCTIVMLGFVASTNAEALESSTTVPVAYIPIELGTLGGPESFVGTSPAAVAPHTINAQGQVAGCSSTPAGDLHAFLWTPGGEMTDLGTLGIASRPFALNDNGQVVGYSNTTDEFAYHPFSWTQATGMLDLGTFGGPTGVARAVNSNGQVVGYADTESGEAHAFLWTESGGMRDLGTLGGGISDAMSISDSGYVAGFSTRDPANTEWRAFVWTDAGGMIELGLLPGGSYSRAVEVNNVGQVVGNADTATEWSHAFSWTVSGGIVDLGKLGEYPEYIASEAIAVSGNGQVIGNSILGSMFPHAFSWTPQGGMVDVCPKIPICSAFAVNDLGQVVGQGSFDLVVFSWTESGGMVDLGNTGAEVLWPIAINNTGQIAGNRLTVIPLKYLPAVLWQPTTDPAQMLRYLLDSLSNAGPGTSLQEKVIAAQHAYNEDRIAAVCSQLSALVNEARAQTNKKLWWADAEWFAATAQQTQALLDCGRQ